mmetsp:Transcript_13643/g.31019  ORF Transcript_13643/g.31019 Transcript_13643/m.31019 type:complete len:531 (-) Transcript_13643:23-1615(-)
MDFAPPQRQIGTNAASSQPSAASTSTGAAARPQCAKPADVSEALHRCRELLLSLPPLEGSAKFRRTWSVEDALEQHQSLMKQHELLSANIKNHRDVRDLQLTLLRLDAEDALKALKAADASSDLPALVKRAQEAAETLQTLQKVQEVESAKAVWKTQLLEQEVAKSTAEMQDMRATIDDVAQGGGPGIVDLPASAKQGQERKFYYCTDCHVGGHGLRYCSYLLKRPNWRVYPFEKWFTDKSGQTSYCPLGRQGVDFADETYFSRISMHIKGRIWLEDKRKLYEFVPEYMPLTFVIMNGKWVGEPPSEPADSPPMPWFVKETDRNWGTSVVCCARPEECLGLAKPDATYVVQKHIPDPLLFTNGEKCHIKFYNLLIGEADGVTWKLYCYKDGYLSISPKPWSPTDLSKETQVTIIRTKRINDWPYWPKVYPSCKDTVAAVIRRAAEQGRLEGRNKKQFEIISADFIVREDLGVYMLEFNTGPVLKDPEDSPDVHDAGMVTGALHLVEPWEGGDEDQWDLALTCKGQPPRAE